MENKNLHSGKEAEEKGRALQEKLKKEASIKVQSSGFVPRNSSDDQSHVIISR